MSYAKKYYKKNKERLLKKASDYYRDNIKKCLETRSKYYKKNKTKCLTKSKECNNKTREQRLKKCRKNYTNIKQTIVDYKGGKCSICGYNKCLRALTFHHCIGKKSFSLSSKMRGCGTSNITKEFIDCLKKEADKCVLVCFNCHMELHSEEYRK